MVDLKQIRKKILAAEEEGKKISSVFDVEEDDEVKSPSWKRELDNFSTSAPLSVGAGILAALIFDTIKNRGDDTTRIFVEPWKTMAVFSGALLFGYGSGKLSRGTVSQKEAERYEKIIAKAEEEFEAQEEEKRAEAEANANQARSNLNSLQAPLQFDLSPSYGSLNTIGEYGAAVGQAGLPLF